MLLTFALHAARNVNTSEIEVFRAFESSLLFLSLFSILNPSRTEELCFLKLSVVFTPRNVFSFSFFCFLLHHFAASPVVKLKSLFYFTQVFSSIQAKHCAFFFCFSRSMKPLLHYCYLLRFTVSQCLTGPSLDSLVSQEIWGYFFVCCFMATWLPKG